jgi:ParB family chromosome partitioning protein
MIAPTVPRETEQAAPAPSDGRSGRAVLDEIRLDLIDVGDNVRVDPGELDEMAASIRELGVLQPVKVVPTGDERYRLVWGQRRVLAARQAGLDRIPAIVEGGDFASRHHLAAPGPKRSIEQLVENLQRADLNAIDEARALRDVLDADATLTQDALAQRLGRSRPWLANRLRLLGLDDEVQARMRSGAIATAHGIAIASLPPKQQRELARMAADGKVSAHQLEREIQWKRDSAEQDERKARKTEKWIPKAIAALADAEVTKDVGLIVTGSYYDLDVEAVRRAVVKAGWRLHDGGRYGYGPSSNPACDCSTVELVVGGRKAEITKVCSDRRHADQKVNFDHVALKKAQEELARHAVAIRAVVAEQLTEAVRANVLTQPVVHLLWLATRGYVNGSAPDDLVSAIAASVATEWHLRDLDVPALLAELGIEVAEPAADAPKKGRRA